MKPKSLNLLVLKGFFCLVMGLLFWVVLQPSYSKLIASVSEKMYPWVQGGDKENTLIRIKGNMIAYIPRGLISSGKENIPVGMKDVRGITYNSVILFALIFFSPGLGVGKKIWVFMAGLSLLFLTQVITVLVQVKFAFIFQLGEYSGIHYGAWTRNITGFLKQFFELVGRFSFPFAIWMFFTYRETIEYLTGREEIIPQGKRKR